MFLCSLDDIIISLYANSVYAISDDSKGKLFMTKNDYIKIFLDSHPNFYKEIEGNHIPDGVIYEEMFLKLSEFSINDISINVPENVTFKYYDGSRQELIEAVEKVIPEWVEFFDSENRIFCALVNGNIASFCLIDDMGFHVIDGKTIKVAGPGCVGTVPEYRRLGIGLAMVQKVTDILKNEGYDYSYIHYTGVAHWYAKLGYRTEVMWNNKEII